MTKEIKKTKIKTSDKKLNISDVMNSATCRCGSKHATMRWFHTRQHLMCDTCWCEFLYEEVD